MTKRSNIKEIKRQVLEKYKNSYTNYGDPLYLHLRWLYSRYHNPCCTNSKQASNVMQALKKDGFIYSRGYDHWYLTDKGKEFLGIPKEENNKVE